MLMVPNMSMSADYHLFRYVNTTRFASRTSMRLPSAAAFAPDARGALQGNRSKLKGRHCHEPFCSLS